MSSSSGRSRSKPAAALHDFFGGTAEINIHGVEAEVFDHFCSFRHDCRICAEKLRGNGMLVLLKKEVAIDFLGVARDAFGRGELRHQQAAASEAADHAAEKRVGDARHRGEDRRRTDGQVANLEARRNHRFSLGSCTRRSKPVHGSANGSRQRRRTHRFHALDALASGKLRPSIACVGQPAPTRKQTSGKG